MDRPIGWSSVPGLAVSSLLLLISSRRLLSPLWSARSFSYIFKEESIDVFLWSPLFYTTLAMGVLYVTLEKSSLSCYTLLTVCSVVLLSEVRFGIEPSERNALLLLFSLIYLQILITVYRNDMGGREDSSLFESRAYRPFTGLAVVAYCLLAVGTAAVVVSVLFVETSPLVSRISDPTPAIAFLVGGEESYYEAQLQFWGAAIAIVFLAVVTDATRYREIRWLTVLALVVNTGAVAFLWYPSLWTATVAAVGALLTVIVVALALDERSETAPT